MNNPKPWIVSRSAHQDLIFCELQRYLRYHALGTGIQKSGGELPLVFGSYVHECCGAAIQGEDWEAVSESFEEWDTLDIEEDMLACQKHLAECLVRGWVMLRLPEILDRYTPLTTEEERIWVIPTEGRLEIHVPIRCDTVMQNKKNGELVGLEFKTTSYVKQDYFDRWRSDLQTLMYWGGITATFGQEPSKIQMEFMVKGSKAWHANSTALWYSSFTRAWCKAGSPPFDEDQFTTDGNIGRRKDWHEFRVWDRYQPKQWLSHMGMDELQGQFMSLDVYRSQDEVNKWLRGFIEKELQLRRRTAIVERQGQADRTMSRRYDADCKANKFNKECEFWGCCFDCWQEPQELIEEGWINRVSHHEYENRSFDDSR